MKYLLLWLILAATLPESPDNSTKTPTQNKVYICNSETATKYHLSSGCRGLNACTSQIVSVTKSEAISRGKKTLCGWED